jgi:MFS family permease
LNPIADPECLGALGRAHRAPAGRPRRPDHPSPLRRDLRAILGEGAAASTMVGPGENYLPAFVLAMGMGQVAAGLIATVPLVVGAFLQLISPAAVRRLGSHRRWVVMCAVLQAVSLVPLSIAALAGSMNTLALFAVAAVYWGAGMGTSPSWSTWVDTLVPERIRAPYFSRRTRVGQIATLAGFVIGGVSLQVGAWSDRRLTAFGFVFLLASVCRFVSAACLASQSEPRPLANGHRSVSMREFFGRFRHSAGGRLLFYLLAVQAAAQIAGPYFTPYMLGPMQLSYASYVTLIAVSFAAKALALPACGTFAKRFGAQKLLWLGGLGIVTVSGLWLISNSFVFLLGVQVVAGVTWAAYELAMFLLFFETIRPEERTSVLTTFNFANAVATVSGSLLGGALLAWCGKSEETYLLLFGLSSAARALSVIALARVPDFATTAHLPSRRAAVQPAAPAPGVEGAPLGGAASAGSRARRHPLTIARRGRERVLRPILKVSRMPAARHL